MLALAHLPPNIRLGSYFAVVLIDTQRRAQVGLKATSAHKAANEE